MSDNNSRTMDDEEWDFWGDECDLGCVGYSSQIDEDALAILKCIKDKKFVSDIAAELKLPEQYVELLQSIFCSIDWCDYGTSPRGCWISHDRDADALITRFEKYVHDRWHKPQPER